MANTTQQLLEKVKKLLDFAKDSRGNEHECLAAARQAEALMRKHNLELKDVILQELTHESAIGVTWVAASVDKKPSQPPSRVPDWMQFIAIPCAKLFDCEVRIERHPTLGVGLGFIGYKTDVQVAEWLFKVLLDAGVRESAKEAYGRGRAYINDWRRGFGSRVGARLKELRAEREAAERGAPGTSLVVSKQAAIAAQFKVKYASRSVRVSSAEAYQRGREAGERQPLSTNRPIESAPQPRRIA